MGKGFPYETLSLRTYRVSPGREGFSRQAWPLQRRVLVNWDIFCDFDGTVALDDVVDSLLERFAPPAWREIDQDWKLGRIGSRECLAQQVPLLDMSRAELDRHLDRIKVDADFTAFVQEARAQGHRLTLVSDGADYAIQRILSRHGLTDIPILSNVLHQRGERSWQLSFSHFQDKCSAGTGPCLCGRGKRNPREPASGRPCLLIGAGASDCCVAQWADLAFAKKGLIGHCALRGLAYQSIQGFSDARRLLPGLAQRLPGGFQPAAAPTHRTVGGASCG
jgi:2-hydroxy-3-keto-5-methylthiopentenyl-1-phosphate phosphatase